MTQYNFNVWHLRSVSFSVWTQYIISLIHVRSKGTGIVDARFPPAMYLRHKLNSTLNHSNWSNKVSWVRPKKFFTQPHETTCRRSQVCLHKK